ncbi:MAG: hypothetical protein JW841_15785 [Deltaproteobacteria bacterium]|nr:hypothetical protein [Deltaproteobacteria bacterium]
MILLTRLPCPEPLASNADKWTKEFIAKRQIDKKERPQKKRYAHNQIIDQLAAMSSQKCFYCECKLIFDTNTQGYGGEETVDHYIEVCVNPSKAYEWCNLYLCCRGCQNKIRENSLSVSECLDPCGTSDPSDHLIFDDEIIRSRNNSTKGIATIKKYKLNRENLAYKRLKQLNEFGKLLYEIYNRQIKEQRQTMIKEELEALHSFAQPDHAYSLMFRWRLKNFKDI